MGDLRDAPPVLLVVALFSRHTEAMAWARDKLTSIYGPIGLQSPTYEFHHTKYYASEMGMELQKQLVAFEQLVDAERLPDIKVQTNELEGELAGSGRYSERRPLNLDPGILSLGKFMLATTKDQAHRIYLRDGIFAEVTLRYQAGAFEPWPWTYADYREPFVLDFLNLAREFYRQRFLTSR